MRSLSPVPAPVLSAALVAGAPGARGGAQALRSVSEAKALGSVSQVEGADVEDVFKGRGIRGVRPQEGLQRCDVTETSQPIKSRHIDLMIGHMINVPFLAACRD